MFPDTLIPIGRGFVTLYGIFIALGVVACMLLLHFGAKKLGVAKDLIEFTETTGYIAIIAGFGGAILFQDFYHYIDTGVWSWTSGITFLGGLITGVITFLIIYFIKRKKISGKLVDILPIVPSCIMVAHGFGRIGCNFAGCCYGLDVDAAIEAGKWPSFLRWMNVDMTRALGSGSEHLIPTQLMEAIFLFAVAGILLLFVMKKKMYNTFPFYLGLYGLWRFWIETIRDDTRGAFIGSITPSQLWSLLMFIAAVPAYFGLRYLTKTYCTADYLKGLIGSTGK